MDDGLRAGFITLEQLRELPIVARQLAAVEAQWPGLGGRRLVYETVRRMINQIVVDVVECSARRIEAAAPASIDEVRAQAAPLIGMGEELLAQHLELKRFLRENLYRHYRVRRMTRKARRVVQDLFRVFMDDVRLMPDEHQTAVHKMESSQGAAGRARAVSDYIAGMTDRYAIGEHERLFVPSERS